MNGHPYSLDPRPRGPWAWRPGNLAVAAALMAAAYWAVRLAYADMLFRRNTPQSLSQALRLAPGNAQYHVRWGELAAQSGADAAVRIGALRQACRLNPHDASIRLELGLREEMEGNFRQAEECLLEAARLDKTHQPRAALAHYYFRRRSWEPFWRWVREALETAPGDAEVLFRLCWDATQDANRICQLAIPPRREILRQYLTFLSVRARWEAAGEILARLTEKPTAEDTPALLAHCERLLEAGKPGPAMAVWNALASRRLIPYEPLAPERGLVLTNPDFLVRPQSRGFDWRIASVEGITIARDEEAGALRITFAGRQPEECQILWQFLPLAPAARYQFRFQYRSTDIPAGSGPAWEVVGSIGKTPVVRSEPLSSDGWIEGRMELAGNARGDAARLALVYRRRPGTTRIAGALWLRGLELKHAE